MKPRRLKYRNHEIVFTKDFFLTAALVTAPNICVPKRIYVDGKEVPQFLDEKLPLTVAMEYIDQLEQNNEDKKTKNP